MTNKYNISDWCNEDEAVAIQLLKDNYSSCMYILGNLINLGPSLTAHPNSGNFKIIKNNDKIIGVYYLARRGNILIVCDLDNEISEVILQHCLMENIPIKGVLAEWKTANFLWEFLLEKKIIKTCSYKSKEVLYQLEPLTNLEKSSEVHLLRESDYSQWQEIQRAFNTEEGLANDLSDEELQKNFLEIVSGKEAWGYFQNNQIISTSALSARAFDIGQIGGVYTLPEFRKQGYSKATIINMLNDCSVEHALGRMILFTGEKNIASQRLYESLGFLKVGHYGMFFE